MRPGRWAERFSVLKGLDEFSDLEGWRSYYLNLMTLIALVLVPIGTLASLPLYISHGHYGLIAFNTAVFLVLFYSFFNASSPAVRSVVFFLTLYGMATTFFVSLGPTHARPGWLILCSVTSTLLFGTSAAFITVALNAVLLVVLIWLVGPHLQAWAAVYTEPASRWIMFIVNISLLSLASSLPVSLLLNRLNTSFLHERNLRNTLSEEKDALRQSEELFRRITENMHDLVCEMNPDATYRYVSPSFKRVLGYEPQDLLGKSVFDRVHPDDRDRLLVEYGEGLRTRTDREVEYRYRHADGHYLWLHSRGSLLFDPSGDIQGAVVTGRDITQRREAEEEKRVLQNQLIQAQKMESMGTLAGGIAHDFNNILSAVIGYAELARISVPPDSDACSHVGQILSAGNRAKQLVQQILTFSRQSRQEMKPTMVSLVVKEALHLLRATIPSFIEIRLSIADGGLVMSDPTQIHQVLMNLCTNAAHAMEPDGGILEVCLQKVEVPAGAPSKELELAQGFYVMLSVSDTGHGIPQDAVERIFEPYYTTKEVGRGTGLGLAVVHGIVMNHGGSIRCTSTQGKGTRFDVYLPELGPADDVREATDEEPPVKGAERILFVDDEPVLAELGKKMLEDLGYTVVACTSSSDALELFRRDSNMFDLVITDMTMPGMTGDRLARRIMEIRPEIPVILCTGYSKHITEAGAKDQGIREYVMKPLELRGLAQTIRKALRAS